MAPAHLEVNTSICTAHHVLVPHSGLVDNCKPLLLPHIASTSGKDADITLSTEFTKSIISSHFAAYNGSHPVDGPAWTTEQATIQVYAVSKAFPLVRGRQALLAMTAWFHLLCNVDDKVEGMDSDTARCSLHQSIDYIRKSCNAREALPALPSSNHESLPRARMLRRDSVTEAPCPSATLRVSAAGPDLKSSSASASLSATIQALTEAFVRQIKAVLRPHTIRKVAESIVCVWQSMCTEIDERARLDGPSLDAYLATRSNTVGLAPFFAVLDDYFCPSDAPDADTPLDVDSDADIIALRAGVNLAVGLQNDLVGLERDLASGEQFNLVNLLQRRDNVTLEQAVATTIELHNDAITLTIDCYNRLVQNSARSHLVTLAESILMFASTHYAWATRSKRYR